LPVAVARVIGEAPTVTGCWMSCVVAVVPKKRSSSVAARERSTTSARFTSTKG
jgi:hypothetical protein